MNEVNQDEFQLLSDPLKIGSFCLSNIGALCILKEGVYESVGVCLFVDIDVESRLLHLVASEFNEKKEWNIINISSEFQIDKSYYQLNV